MGRNMPVEFAADFETSKDIVFKDIDLKKSPVLPVVKIEEINGKKQLIETTFQKREIDVEKSKTWVYLWGIESLDESFYREGYDIESFINFLENYPNDMKIYFHNEKFDGSFILWYFQKNKHRFRQLLECENKWANEFINENNINDFDFFTEKKKMNGDVFRNPINEFFKDEGYVEKRVCKQNKVFYQTSVNNMGVMYSIKIWFLKEDDTPHIVEIYDSMKLLNFSVREIAKKFLGIPNFDKLDYDYETVRLENRPDLLTDDDHKYIKRDIDIMAKALFKFKNSTLFASSTDKNTIASLALSEFKTILAEKVKGKKVKNNNYIENVFRQLFPLLPDYEDDFVRKSYKGGFVYVHPDNQNREIKGKGMCVLDVNSLFPSVMLFKPMPFGRPHIVKKVIPVWQKQENSEIETIKDSQGNEYDYYFVRIKVNLKIKKNHIPSIMLKGTDINMNWPKDENNKRQDKPENLTINEFITSTENNLVELILSKDDYELMYEQYDVLEHIISEIYYFQTVEGIFADYINKWGEVKIQATKEKNNTNRNIAKLMLNSLYGKFGAKPINKFKFFELKNNALVMRPQLETVDKSIYVPVAAAITSGGRRKTIETSQKLLEYSLKKYNKNMYCYSDTDSIHTMLNIDDCIECLKDELDVNKTGELGLWDAEHTNISISKFIRAKTYLEVDEDGNISSGCAGLPKEFQEVLTVEYFKQGVTFLGKLSPHQVVGGQCLIEDTFTLKEDKKDV